MQLGLLKSNTFIDNHTNFIQLVSDVLLPSFLTLPFKKNVKSPKPE